MNKCTNFLWLHTPWLAVIGLMVQTFVQQRNLDKGLSIGLMFTCPQMCDIVDAEHYALQQWDIKEHQLMTNTITGSSFYHSRLISSCLMQEWFIIMKFTPYMTSVHLLFQYLMPFSHGCQCINANRLKADFLLGFAQIWVMCVQNQLRDLWLLVKPLVLVENKVLHYHCRPTISTVLLVYNLYTCYSTSTCTHAKLVAL